MNNPKATVTINPQQVHELETDCCQVKGKQQSRKIWIDLDNTPHVPFFKPIIKGLEQRGYSIQLTGRDAFQVCELAERSGMKIIKVGKHYGKNRIAKIFGLVYRALQLAPYILPNKPMLGISHGARSQLLLCNLLNIPTVLLADYEYARIVPFAKPTWMIVPEIIPNAAVCCINDKILKYPGIKENVYAPGFIPDPTLRGSLGLRDMSIVVTVRPPATEAHYHNPESEELFDRLMTRLNDSEDVQTILLPRNNMQAEHLTQKHPKWFVDHKTIIPAKAVDGLNLIWQSDLVVSGGGTMNREAAALGVPVYSIFRGKMGAVDRNLNKDGQLVLIECIEDVDRKIKLEPRDRSPRALLNSTKTLECILDHIDYIFRSMKSQRSVFNT
jgi:predicted glycosyltransferase